MHLSSLYEIHAYKHALPWQIEEVRSTAMSISGQPVWMPTPDPADELDADQWIALLLDHDRRGIRTEPPMERVDYKPMILDLLSGGSEYTSTEIAEMIGVTPNKAGVLLRTMRDAKLVDNGDGTRQNGRFLQTWCRYTEAATPKKSLEWFLLGCKKETVQAARLLQDKGPLPVSALAEYLGVANSSVFRIVKPLKRSGYMDRKRFDLTGGAYKYYLVGDHAG